MTQAVCLLISCIHTPVSADQSRTLQSCAPVASKPVSSDASTQEIACVWPTSENIFLKEGYVHTVEVPSDDPVRTAGSGVRHGKSTTPFTAEYAMSPWPSVRVSTGFLDLGGGWFKSIITSKSRIKKVVL